MIASNASTRPSGRRPSQGPSGHGDTVAAYLAGLEGERRKGVEVLRELVSEGLPSAHETMSYGMPTWELGGRPVCALASQKHHLALYFCETPVLDRHREAFSHLDVGRSCIRFERVDELPTGVLRKMLSEVARESVG